MRLGPAPRLDCPLSSQTYGVWHALSEGSSQNFMSSTSSMERNVAKLFTEKVKIFGRVKFSQVRLVSIACRSSVPRSGVCFGSLGGRAVDLLYCTRSCPSWVRANCRVVELEPWLGRMSRMGSAAPQASILAAIAQVGLKSWVEYVRLQTLGRAGLQQLQLDVHFLRPQLRRFAASGSSVDSLLDEVRSTLLVMIPPHPPCSRRAEPLLP